MKKEYKNIMVAVDGSEQSYHAVQEAVEVTKRNGGKLQIVTVKDNKRYYGMAGAGFVETPGLDQMAQEILNEASRLVGDKVEVTLQELSGTPKYRIVSFAEEHNIDLIVIGSTGAGVIDKLMLGSTTQYVVSHAPCNVMVIK